MLTQGEADTLPNGTRVRVIWAEGGDGPKDYEIINYHGQSWAIARDSDGRIISERRLEFVGEQRWQTKVWTISK